MLNYQKDVTKMSHTKASRRVDDWKRWKSGWKYKSDAPQNREWKKDRAKLFKKNGNGWWLLPTKRSEKGDE